MIVAPIHNLACMKVLGLSQILIGGYSFGHSFAGMVKFGLKYTLQPAARAKEGAALTFARRATHPTYNALYGISGRSTQTPLILTSQPHTPAH